MFTIFLGIISTSRCMIASFILLISTQKKTRKFRVQCRTMTGDLFRINSNRFTSFSTVLLLGQEQANPIARLHYYHKSHGGLRNMKSDIFTLKLTWDHPLELSESWKLKDNLNYAVCLMSIRNHDKGSQKKYHYNISPQVVQCIPAGGIFQADAKHKYCHSNGKL